MKKPELLAPAGDLESGYAALYYGADALYLGLKSFSARAGAVNFTPKELDELTAYAHHLNRQVYVTVNTLIQEHELPDLLQTLNVCRHCHVDAVIVQDLGVARLIHQCYPDLILHASTQMAVHNVEGALALQKLGFKRVVLARELTLSEIEKIAQLPNLETEAFIHGALCYSYSGLCLFSSMATGRSANRGKCAYPCRSLFTGLNQTSHFFSMKDMALGMDVLKMPVTSLKIEGRKKKALYVAAVVDYYRHILDNKVEDVNRQERIRQIFSRLWTKFHFHGKSSDVIDPNFVGHRGLFIGKTETLINRHLSFVTQHDLARFDGLQIEVAGIEKPVGFSVQELFVNHKSVFQANAHQKVEVVIPPHTPFIPKGSAVYLASSTAVKGAYPFTMPKPDEYKNRLSIPVSVQLYPDKICATALSWSAQIPGTFTTAKDIDKMNQTVQNVFNKYKDTDFQPVLQIQNTNNVFVPMSLLNQLRRELYHQIVITPAVVSLPPLSKTHVPKGSQWLIKTDCLDVFSHLDFEKWAEMILVLSPNMTPKDLSFLPKKKIRLALPPVLLDTVPFQSMIQQFLQNGFHKWEISNWGHLEMLPKTGIDVSWDSSLYMMNTQAIQMAKEMGASRITLSVEDTHENLKNVIQKTPLPTVWILYQDVPLFLSRNCIKNQCATCRRTECILPIKKEKQKLQVRIQGCQVTVTDEKPLCFGKEASQLTPDFYRIDFVNHAYTPEQIQSVISLVQAGKTVASGHTGNFYREI